MILLKRSYIGTSAEATLYFTRNMILFVYTSAEGENVALVPSEKKPDVDRLERDLVYIRQYISCDPSELEDVTLAYVLHSEITHSLLGVINCDGDLEIADNQSLIRAVFNMLEQTLYREYILPYRSYEGVL